MESIVAFLEENALPPGAGLTSRDAAGRDDGAAMRVMGDD